jgi:ParB-like chromosome segregation protein Spo0J
MDVPTPKPWPEMQQALRPLTRAELAALKASIERDGITHAIVVLPDGRIIDGHHRYAIAGGDAPVMVRDLDEAAAFDHGLDLNVVGRQMTTEDLREMRAMQKRRAAELREAGATQRETAEEVGVSQKTVHDWESSIANIPSNNGDQGDGAMSSDASNDDGPPVLTKPPDKRRKLSDEQRAEIVKRAAEGETQKKIAADYGVAQATVHSIVKRDGDDGQRPAGRRLVLIEAHVRDTDNRIADIRGCAEFLSKQRVDELILVATRHEQRRWLSYLKQASTNISLFRQQLEEEARCS